MAVSLVLAVSTAPTGPGDDSSSIFTPTEQLTSDHQELSRVESCQQDYLDCGKHHGFHCRASNHVVGGGDCCPAFGVHHCHPCPSNTGNPFPEHGLHYFCDKLNKKTITANYKLYCIHPLGYNQVALSSCFFF